jgi:hypothetical protein
VGSGSDLMTEPTTEPTTEQETVHVPVMADEVVAMLAPAA